MSVAEIYVTSMPETSEGSHLLTWHELDRFLIINLMDIIKVSVPELESRKKIHTLKSMSQPDYLLNILNFRVDGLL